MGYNYRQAWLLQFAQFLGYPALVLAFVLRITQIWVDPASVLASLSHSKVLFSALYVLAVPLFWSIRNMIKTMKQSHEARVMGANVVPRVRGKWPGNADIMLRLLAALKGGYVAEVWAALAEEYGLTYNIRLLWSDMIVTLDHELVKFILATGFNHFGKGEEQTARIESFLGNGIFNRNGTLWKFHRGMTRPFFSRERFSDFDLYDRYTHKLLKRVSEHAEQGQAIDIQDLFARLTMDAAGEFLFASTEINSLDDELPVAGRATHGPRGTAPVATAYGDFVQAFDEVQSWIPVRGRMGPFIWPLVEWKEDKAKKHREVIDAWVWPLLDAAFTRRNKWLAEGGDAKVPAGDTFLDDLVSSTDDRSLIADELVNILLAARDTTASLLTFATYLLTQHPDMFARLRAEIMEHVGPYATPTYEQIKSMRYLRAVLNETLRLFPSVPINERATMEPVAVPTSQGTWYIPGPQVPVVYIVVHMQRREDLWGPDAEKFDPDRWLDDRVKAFVADPMRFVPFNAGPRICLGQQFALNEASFVLIRLLQRFDIFELAMEAAPEGSIPPPEWADAKGRKGIEKIWPRNAVTLYSKGGMWVRAHKA